MTATDPIASPASSEPHGPRFKPRLHACRSSPIDSVEFTLRAGLCIASLELIGDQAKRLTGWVGDQQFHVPEFGVMQPRRRRPPA